MQSLAASVQRYLFETLGVPSSGHRPWVAPQELPRSVKNVFDLHELDILGNTILLALEHTSAPPSLADLRLRLGKVRSIAERPVVYVTQALTANERKRLIAQKVPFIVPGNQLYLPDLGLDLREYFRRRHTAAESPLSPSAQAMLIAALLRPQWTAQWLPVEVAATLGYTPMTLSRVVRELAECGLASVGKTGRFQHLTMGASPRDIWDQIKPRLRSPVLRTVHTNTPIPPELPTRLAGRSALAHHGLWHHASVGTVRAVNRTAWQALATQLTELPEPTHDTHAWQIWLYSPSLQADSHTVDPLSLILSLRDDPDASLHGALDSLEQQLPW